LLNFEENDEGPEETQRGGLRRSECLINGNSSAAKAAAHQYRYERCLMAAREVFSVDEENRSDEDED